MVGADRVKEPAGMGLHQVISAGLYRPRWSWPERIDGPNYVGRFWPLPLRGGALVIILVPTTDAGDKPAVHFAEIIALGLGSWGRRCESSGKAIEIRPVNLRLKFEDGKVRVGTYPVWPVRPDMVRP
jgi:hypothetical protein